MCYLYQNVIKLIRGLKNKNRVAKKKATVNPDRVEGITHNPIWEKQHAHVKIHDLALIYKKTLFPCKHRM